MIATSLRRTSFLPNINIIDTVYNKKDSIKIPRHKTFFDSGFNEGLKHRNWTLEQIRFQRNFDCGFNGNPKHSNWTPEQIRFQKNFDGEFNGGPIS